MRYDVSDFTDVAPEKLTDAIVRMGRLHSQLGAALAQLRQSAVPAISADSSHQLGDAA